VTGAGGMFRLLILAIPLFGLAGCIKSDAPLIDESKAQYPFRSMSVKDDNGQVLSIKRDGNVYRLLEEPGELSQGADKSEASGLAYLVHDIGNQQYLVQETGDGQKANFGFAKRNGDKLVVRWTCEGLAADVLRKAGVQTVKPGPESDEPDCRVKDLAALVTLSKSPGIWSKGTTTLEILAIE
jgi:hypothetical protein